MSTLIPTLIPTLRIFVLGIVALGLLSSVAVFAGSDDEKSATYQMAEIMHRLKHYPSPAGKEVLNKITQAANTTANERTIATAMVNLQHKVVSSDIPKLEAVIADKKATVHERELASIVLSLDHRPTKQDKTKLKAMMQ
ncbi:hypothetical protein MNBD_GAMMA19-2250 [hydrothermal vent metagenome]|uniref:Uncharacterized protein n=1 Tax=hydrothermal vent metagenome TaxID=652676 RepID=A0A3B1AA07_9ZZZZ